MCKDLSKSLGAGKGLPVETPKWGCWKLERLLQAAQPQVGSPRKHHQWQADHQQETGSPVTFFIAHFCCLQNFEISLHVELIPKASSTENKQRQQTPLYRKAVYQVLRAKFPTSQENKRRATRNCTVAQAAKRLRQQPQLFLQPSQKRKHWLAPRMG